MRVLLDENLPHDLIATLVGHEVVTVQGLGWSGTLNGALLKRTSGVADAFVTMDRKLERQHDLTKLAFGVVVVEARSNKMQDLLPLVEPILRALATVKPGQVARSFTEPPRLSGNRWADETEGTLRFSSTLEGVDRPVV